MGYPIRVVFYEPYPMGLGGNFLTQRLFLQGLDRKRFLPIVVAPIEGVALDQFRAIGVECVVMPPPGELGSYGGAVLRAGMLGRLKSVCGLLLYNFHLARFFRRRKIDVVYSNCVRAQLSAGLGAMLAGVPSFLYIKGEMTNPFIDRISLLIASRVVFQSESNAGAKYKSIVRMLRSKIGIIKPGLEFEKIDLVEARDPVELRRELGIDDACFNTAVIGQLSLLKGVHCVIEAMAGIVREFPHVRLYIVGDCVIEDHEAYKKKLVGMVDRLGLKKHVFFTGWRNDSLAIMRCMSAVIQPSFTEGFSWVVLESMAMARPLIATDVGGHAEVVADGITGFLIPPNDPGSIARRWRDLVSNPSLAERIGREARRAVSRDYRIEEKVAQISGIWSEMAAGRTPEFRGSGR